jgi:hypothetical protein
MRVNACSMLWKHTPTRLAFLGPVVVNRHMLSCERREQCTRRSSHKGHVMPGKASATGCCCKILLASRSKPVGWCVQRGGTHALGGRCRLTVADADGTGKLLEMTHNLFVAMHKKKAQSMRKKRREISISTHPPRQTPTIRHHCIHTYTYTVYIR